MRLECMIALRGTEAAPFPVFFWSAIFFWPEKALAFFEIFFWPEKTFAILQMFSPTERLYRRFIC